MGQEEGSCSPSSLTLGGFHRKRNHMELLIRSASGQLAVIALLKAVSPVWTRLRVGSGGCEKGVKEPESQTVQAF